MRGKLLFIAFLILSFQLSAQYSEIPEEKEISHSSGLWLGAYTKYKVSKRMFYYGEYHYRRRNNFVQDMAQIYLRFGTTYLVTKKFEVTTGIVTPIYWAPNQNAENIDKIIMQFRFWQQFLFVQPVSRVKIYHQLRFEQRWKRDYEIGSSFELTHRFRYKLTAYLPLNHDHLVNKTLFFSFYEEIFIQAGKSVIYDHFEDNRVFMGLGYIINENFQVQAGYMWTFRHNGGPFKYEHRHIPRISIYHNLDLYRMNLRHKQERIQILEEEF